MLKPNNEIAKAINTALASDKAKKPCEVPSE